MINNFLNSSGRPPLILAPMAGITDAPCRRLARRYGADLAVSEMLASQALIRGRGKGRSEEENRAEPPPLVVQIAGADPVVMAEAARLQVGLGARVIDINMGCPVKKIVKSGSGAALLRDEVLAGRIMAAVVAAVSVPVTVKIRLGWDADSLNACRMVEIAAREGISWLTVHGRTRAQMYEGQADWGAIARVKAASTIPVVGNGDVRTPEDARRLVELTGVDGVMIGRAALGRPWLFRRVAAFLERGAVVDDPPLAEQHDVAREHFLDLLSFHGVHTGIRLARKHLAWYVRGLPGAARFRDRINQMEEPEAVLGELAGIFETIMDPENRTVFPGRGSHPLGCATLPGRTTCLTSTPNSKS